MSSVRYFSGGRDPSTSRSKASDLMKLEIMKKGKLDPTERYKRIMKKRFEENKLKAFGGKKIGTGFRLPGSLKEARRMSKRAEEALKQVAARKAAKEAKAERQMVLVTPRTYPTGNITKNGKIYDVAGNMVATVNRKNGKIATTMGWSVGKYKPKSYFTDMTIQDTIHKYSPYYINMRKMQALQQGQLAEQMYGGHHSGNTSIYGGGGVHAGSDGLSQYYGMDVSGPRQNVGVTAWGAMSDNAWGTFADNVWGGSLDNVWGGNMSDVWGGIGAPSMWGVKGQHIWGTGNGTNYLRKLTAHVVAFFGLSLKGKSVHDGTNASRSGSSAHEHANSSRSGGAHEHVNSGTRTAGAAHEHAAQSRAPATRSAPSTRH